MKATVQTKPNMTKLDNFYSPPWGCGVHNKLEIIMITNLQLS